MQDLILLDQPIEVSGFSAPEIDQILIGEEEDALETAALEPEPHAVCVSERGDLWRLGDHRLLCGDATDARSFERVLMGSVARLVLTDVPFNVPIARHVTSRPHREFVQASGEMTEDEFYRFNLAWIQVAKAGLPDGGLLATFIDWRSVGLILRLGSDLDLPLLNLIVWAKTNAGMGSLWRSQHELLPVFKVGSGRHLNNIELGRHGRHRSNVWTYPGASSLGSDSRRGLKIHPAVKPVAMLRDMILDVTHRGDVVLDPFLGSGSTLMAAQDCGRRACGIELDPLYVDVAVRRWEASTGLSAVLEATGETFSEIQSRCPRDAGRFPPSSPQLRLPSPPSKET